MSSLVKFLELMGVLEEGKEEVAREECRGVLDQIVIKISIDNKVPFLLH